MWERTTKRYHRANKNNDVIEENEVTVIKLFGLPVKTYKIEYTCERPDEKPMGLRK